MNVNGGNLQQLERPRICIGGVRWIGDAVMTIPALRRVRELYPHAHITLAAQNWARDVFSEVAFLDEVWSVDESVGNKNKTFVALTAARFTLARAWRRRKFDAAFILQNSFASALVPFLARVPVRIGYNSDGRKLLLTDAVETPLWRASRHEVFYYLNLIESYACRESINVNQLEVPPLALTVSKQRQAHAREILESNGRDATKPLVVICPGSTNSRAKRWHAESYARLADKLISETKTEVAFIGAPEETFVTERITNLMREQAIVLTGATTLAESIAVTSLAALVISNDTGPAHIAAALERPTIVIFGPTKPETTRPFSPLATVIRKPPACAPCMLRDCPIDHRCMTNISVEQVFKCACQTLNSYYAENVLTHERLK